MESPSRWRELLGDADLGLPAGEAGLVLEQPWGFR